jgi:hypothetical protein
VYWAKVTQQLTLSRRYSQLVANRCCRLACSLLETPFVTRDFFVRKICSWTDLFVMRCVREMRFHCSVLIAYILRIWRVQFMEIGCQGVRNWNKAWETPAVLAHSVFVDLQQPPTYGNIRLSTSDLYLFSDGSNTPVQLSPVCNDSVSTVYRGPKKNWKIKEINGSWVSKRPPSENGP